MALKAAITAIMTGSSINVNAFACPILRTKHYGTLLDAENQEPYPHFLIFGITYHVFAKIILEKVIMAALLPAVLD
jgi:hypothetical protein